MAKKRGLGKSLEALLAYTDHTNDPQPIHEDEGQALSYLSVDQIERSPYQPRQAIDPESLAELAESIRTQGILQPLVVRKRYDHFEVIAGERRLNAARLIGLQLVPVLVRNVSDQAAMTIALIENIQREDLNAIETAEAIQKLIDELRLTHEEVASALGKSRASISNYLRLLSLPVEIKALLLEKKIEMGHARALLALPEDVRLRIAHEVAEKQLSVRDIEAEARRLSLFATLKAGGNQPIVLPPSVLQVKESLSRFLKLKVDVKTKANGAGKVIIKYRRTEELERLLHMMDALPVG